MSRTRNMLAVLAALFALAFAAPAPSTELATSVRLTETVIEWCNMQIPLACQLVPTEKSTVKGRVLFSPIWRADKCSVKIQAVVTGLEPMKKQAIHIHKFGDLFTSSAKSLGGHFTSPNYAAAMKHGLPNSAERHWGDFGSLDIGPDGVAKYDRIDTVITLAGIVGRGMVVHAGEDRGAAMQPSGGAGARKAMCVIGYANPAYGIE